MADRPIIFSAPMVLALLDGRKTQTRRLIRCAEGTDFHRQTEGRHYFGFNEPRDDGRCGVQLPCLPYAVGDRLYVRENWRAGRGYDGGSIKNIPPFARIWFDADDCNDNCDGIGRNLRPCIHMPRWASRLTLLVADVRVQRLQDISEEDAIAEGVERGVHPITGDEDGWKDYSIIHAGPHKGKRHPHAVAPWKSARLSFQSLWDTLHGVENWNENPFVVAVTFRVERGNIDSLQT